MAPTGPLIVLQLCADCKSNNHLLLEEYKTLSLTHKQEPFGQQPMALIGFGDIYLGQIQYIGKEVLQCCVPPEAMGHD